MSNETDPVEAAVALARQWGLEVDPAREAAMRAFAGEAKADGQPAAGNGSDPTLTAAALVCHLLDAAVRRIADLEERLVEEIRALGVGYDEWANEAARLADLLVAAMRDAPEDSRALEAAHEALKTHLALRGT